MSLTSLRQEVSGDELLLALALVLIAKGFSEWWPPGAYLVPGLVLLWIGLPSRIPFVARPLKKEKSDGDR